MRTEDKDFKIETYPERKHGYLYVGISKGIKVTHIPSGEFEISENADSQLKNKDIAMNKLKRRLWVLNEEQSND